MTNGAAFDEPAHYQIRVKGTLDPTRSAWFEGLEIIARVHQETILTGQIPDQAALHGLLLKIHNLGLPLLSVLRKEEDKP